MKKQPKKVRKTVIFEPRKCENRGSVAKLYYNSNGGMRVGGAEKKQGFIMVVQE